MNNVNETRRGFLKKVVYVAPAVVALGALSAPANSYASDSGLTSGVIKVDGKDVNVIVDPNDPIGNFVINYPVP